MIRDNMGPMPNPIFFLNRPKFSSSSLTWPILTPPSPWAQFVSPPAQLVASAGPTQFPPSGPVSPSLPRNRLTASSPLTSDFCCLSSLFPFSLLRSRFFLLFSAGGP
ncbi:hypothetical protein Droror1_Dr00020991 [Drosera rotundifolia]